MDHVISPDGSADLYAHREESGAIQGEPIHLAANAPRAVAMDALDADEDE